MSKRDSNPDDRDSASGHRDGRPAPEGPRRVTLKDLAEHLDLSAATISRALNGSPQADALSPETRRRVEEAARELNYRPNYLARSLRGKRSFSVGVLVPEISEGYTAGLMSGVEVRLREDGYRYLMVSHHSEGPLLDEALDMLLDRGVEGFVLIAVRLRRKLPVPAVVLSGLREDDGADRVVLDHDRAAELALGHLQELGHRRIAFFRGHGGNVDSEDRWRAIVECAARRGIPIGEDLVL
ncbi:MAG: LacI family transcriptional regulator, partial [Holophagales bacterium]|nr:LacI family transcriptional regulator [Holophagales bacterium]